MNKVITGIIIALLAGLMMSLHQLHKEENATAMQRLEYQIARGEKEITVPADKAGVVLQMVQKAGKTVATTETKTEAFGQTEQRQVTTITIK